MTEPTDEDLMAAFAAGDAAAFERLYARHQGGLHRFVRRLLGGALAPQADEVYQDTWLRVVQSCGRWRPQDGAGFKTWLYTLAHHRAIDLWRRSGREVSSDAVDDNGTPRHPEASAAVWRHWPAPSVDGAHGDELLFWRRAGERLLRCLEALPPLQRSAFLLHHDDGMALADVARSLGVGFETAKTRLRYAMDKLRACMGAYLAPLGLSGEGA